VTTPWSAGSESGTLVVNGVSTALGSNANIQAPYGNEILTIVITYPGSFTIKVELR
jgi:hypothetical protein